MRREIEHRPISKLELARRRVSRLVSQLAYHRALPQRGRAWKEAEADYIQQLAIAQIGLEQRERRSTGGRKEGGGGGAMEGLLKGGAGR